MSVRRRAALVAAVIAIAALGTTGLAPTPVAAAPAPRPVLFVHGFAGSANQYASQAQRFASNGYPATWVDGIDYDTTFGVMPMAGVWDVIDARIAALKAIAGTDQVDLVGHSLGTGVSQGYLNSNPDRAASVAHYVNLDGATAGAPPGGVPTLAVWGQGNPAREVTGATNTSFPDQTHTQVVTSPESFAAQYTFLTGAPPGTTDVVREHPDQVTIAGRAVQFISNLPPTDVTLEIWRVDPATGFRLGGAPEATPALTADGSFGPLSVTGGAHYELVLVRNATSAHHFYLEPFARDDLLVRLLTSEPGAGLDALWDKSPVHSNIVFLRMKEWWGDQGEANDSLTIAGTELITPETAPISKRAIAAFAFDDGADQVSHPGTAIPEFFALPFLTAVDLYLPATTPPAGTIALVERPRLGGGAVVTLNVPNWASATDRTSVQFLDYHHTADPPTPPSTPASSTTTATSSTGGGVRPVSVATPVAVTPRFTG